MKILYIGDIMASPGMKIVQELLPDMRREHQVDLVIAQAENVSDGKSMTPIDMKLLQAAGVDFFTGGNHTPKRTDLHALLEDSKQPVIMPANMAELVGKGWKYIDSPQGPVLVISILGQTVGTKVEITNPLQKMDEILGKNEGKHRVATVVNFHGDFSSEKRVIGYYLDGKVTAVIGDHWHVPTADAMVLPKGTAHITDVGMCGTLHSSLGVKFETIIARWRDEVVNQNEIELGGPLQFNALLIETDNRTGLAKTIQSIQKIL
jgi:metallophosphoesterase (TIGR00282 family)